MGVNVNLTCMFIFIRHVNSLVRIKESFSDKNYKTGLSLSYPDSKIKTFTTGYKACVLHSVNMLEVISGQPHLPTNQVRG